jgi:hypothetical protein
MEANEFSKKLTAVVNEAAKAGVPIQWICATLDSLKFNLQFQTYVSEQQNNAKKFAENMANGSKIIKPR